MVDSIRVIIADDSALARSLLREYFEEAGGFDIVAEAENGRRAVELTAQLRPDLVTMDLEMPVMGGMDAIEEIMSVKAAPILVVSSVADAHNAYEAVARGAVDVIGKPGLDETEQQAFVDKARLVAKIPVITRMKSQRKSAEPAPPKIEPVAFNAAGGADMCFAVASSTGGPQALASILAELPADFPAPILIAQHISDGFAPGMAEWLGGLSRLPVKLACEGMSIEGGCIYISPSESHMAVTPSRRLTLLERKECDVYRPSCNALLESAAAVWGRKCVGVILTGMGSDGARGMGMVKTMGGATIAQDEASSVIWGMNRVAVENGSIDRTLPLGDIAQVMCRMAGGRA